MSDEQFSWDQVIWDQDCFDESGFRVCSRCDASIPPDPPSEEAVTFGQQVMDKDKRVAVLCANCFMMMLTAEGFGQ